MMPCCSTMRKNVRSFEFQNPWRNSIFSDWLDLNFNLASELPQTLTCCWFPLVLMSDWNRIGYSLMHHHQFPRLHHDGILHVALIPYPTGSLLHAILALPRSVGLILGTLIETFGLTLAASYFKHGLVYFFARNPLETERETVLQRESSEFCGQETYMHIPQGDAIVSSLCRGFCSPIDIPPSTWTLRNVPRANVVRLLNTLTVRKMAINHSRWEGSD